MSLRFLAPLHPNGIQGGLALARYGDWAKAFDRQVIEIYQSRLRDSLGRPPLKKELESFLERACAAYNDDPYGLEKFRLFIGFHIPNLRHFDPLRPNLRPTALKGIGAYVKMDMENYTIENLGTHKNFEKQGMATCMMLGILQSIQDECLLADRKFMHVWLLSVPEKEVFYQKKFHFNRVSQTKSGRVIMRVKLLATQELPSCWLWRQKPETNRPIPFPDRIYYPTADLNVA